MTQEHLPDHSPAGPVDDYTSAVPVPLSPSRTDTGSGAPGATGSPGGPVYGPATTVAARGRAPKRARTRGRVGAAPLTDGLAGPDGDLAGGTGGRQAQARRPRRGPFAWLGDSRGLTFLGAVLVAGIIGTVGGVISAGTRGWVGTVFTACFIAGCVLAAVLVHREDLLTVAFLPPLLFVAIATAVGIAQAELASSSVKKKVVFQVGYAMSFGARTMWVASGATAVVALLMFVVRRRPARPRATATARPVSDGSQASAF
ncbi:MAG: hypothetical protein QOF57_1837 [Frankiaceae bacterium]|jgi:hypothetical protein|nr:hypothetical protein [Frankiaceae bacterium]